MHARWIDIEQSLDVAFGFAGDRDDRVGHFQRGLFHPEREIVTAAELFPLPRPQRLERMHRDDERNSVIQFRQDPAEMTVPSVTMHEIGIDVRRVEVGAATDRAEDGLQFFRASEIARVEFEAGDLESAFFETLLAEAANIDIDCFGQLAREIIDVHARAAVNVRRIFVRQELNFHDVLKHEARLVVAVSTRNAESAASHRISFLLSLNSPSNSSL